MSLLLIVIIISFLVFIHELGHFLVAKRSGMKVEEFGFGYPPRLLTFFTDSKGTVYTLNWLPFGGFVRLFGEEGPASVDEETTSKRAFFNQPVKNRLAVVLAGAFINFVFGAIAFGAVYTQVGIPTPVGGVVIEQVEPDSPASRAGIEEQAVVTGVAPVENGGFEAVSGVDDFVAYLGEHEGKEVVLQTGTLENGEIVSASANTYAVYVRTEEELGENQGALGVVISDVVMRHYPFWQMPFRGMWVGMTSAVEFGWMLLTTLGGMVGRLITQGDVPQQLSGPFGIAYDAQKAGLHQMGVLGALNFTAILSVNLAIINVLPIPALDGGRALFLFYEAVRGKRLPPELEQRANMVGFLLLLLLIVLISVRDIARIVSDEALQQWVRGMF